jgi:hypothetical protein
MYAMYGSYKSKQFSVRKYTFGLCLISWEGLYGKEIKRECKEISEFLFAKNSGKLLCTLHNLSSVLWQVSLLTATTALKKTHPEPTY